LDEQLEWPTAGRSSFLPTKTLTAAGGCRASDQADRLEPQACLKAAETIH